MKHMLTVLLLTIVSGVCVGQDTTKLSLLFGHLVAIKDAFEISAAHFVNVEAASREEAHAGAENDGPAEGKADDGGSCLPGELPPGTWLQPKEHPGDQDRNAQVEHGAK